MNNLFKYLFFMPLKKCFKNIDIRMSGDGDIYLFKKFYFIKVFPIYLNNKWVLITYESINKFKKEVHLTCLISQLIYEDSNLIKNKHCIIPLPLAESNFKNTFKCALRMNDILYALINT